MFYERQILFYNSGALFSMCEAYFFTSIFYKIAIVFYLLKFLKKTFALLFAYGKVLGKGLLWKDEFASVRIPPL